MNNFIKAFCVLSVSLLSGCAHLDFGDDKGLTYFDPKPYLFVSTTKDCVTTATIVIMPESKKEVKLISGYGTSDLSVALSNGMITSVGQKTDTKIPETIASVASLATAAGGIMKVAAVPGKQVICKPTATLYPVVNGIPVKDASISFRVDTDTVDLGGTK